LSYWTRDTTLYAPNSAPGGVWTHRSGSMATDAPATPADLERFRPYLRLIAQLHLPAALRGKALLTLKEVRVARDGRSKAGV
jgi:hypothetical protein